MIEKIIKKIMCKIKYRRKIQGSEFELRKNASIKISKNGFVRLGKSLINENAFICASDAGKVTIEDNVTINRNSIVVAKKDIFIGAGTSIGPNVCIYDHDHKYDETGFKKNEFSLAAVHIGKNVWIGANVVVLKGSDIGDNSIIGAGTIVKGEIAPKSIVFDSRTSVKKNII